ncbi:DUF1360 domain-containing protein [Bacillus sp. REN10]|uniref:DUF1360 domain-containing protein n=1 Tax=Bacillus sp. REN10 TaxID=2782541 RepID=UPI001EEE5581|nr:DUF1360 domain-containing protein [Bacillus sp. REN10]
MTTIELFILIFASFRLTRLLVFDEITEKFRQPFFSEVIEWSENGEKETFVMPKESGILGFFGRMLNCYWCTGFWVSLFCVFLYVYFPMIAQPFLLIFAVSGGAALIETVVQYLINDEE